MALPQQTEPLPPAQLTRTQQRFVPVLLDPATRHLPVLELAQHAGLSAEASWFDALCDEPFRAWVEQLGRRCPPARPSVADALAGRIPIEQGLSPAQQRFWHLLQDPANRTLARRYLCRKAGYTTDGPWYAAVRDPAFRAWVRSLGIKCTMIPKRALRLDPGPVPLAEDIDAEWAQDRIDIRRITSDYPKHKTGGDYTIDFSFIQHPDLKALIKRYFRARVGYWTGTTMVSTLPAFKPIIQELERRYPGLSSFASLTREMLEPVLAMTGWVDSMERHYEMTAERRLHTVILLQAMFTYMQRHHWPEAPQQLLIYDEDFPQRIRHQPRPIPEAVMEQLLAHLDRLSPYDQHLVQIMSVMGLRSVDALHLVEDCLEYDAAGDPRVRWYNVKMKREVRPLPVSREVEAAILAQREPVKDIPDVYGQRYLFRTTDGLYTYERFWAHLNALARDVPILGPSGQVFRFRPHAFRHTVGTEMINNGMGLADVMTYLDHQSAEMTRNYTQIYDETLKHKFKELVLSGRAVGGIALQALREQIAAGDESELDWVVANLRKLSLPWGQCLHHAKAPKCPYGQNVCFTKDNGPCHKLVTTPEHAPVIVATLEDLRKSKQIAEEQGWELYANDLGDQIRGMEQVLRELALPADERPENRGGRKATNETEH